MTVGRENSFKRKKPPAELCSGSSSYLPRPIWDEGKEKRTKRDGTKDTLQEKESVWLLLMIKCSCVYTHGVKETEFLKKKQGISTINA